MTTKPWEYVNTLDTFGYQVSCLGTVTRLVSLLPSRREIHLLVTRAYVGWSAIDENTYDASYEGEDETGEHWTQGEHGIGKTENEAIDDLFDQFESERVRA